MKTGNSQISIQQILAISMLGILTPVTRSLVSLGAQYAERAGWVMALFASIYVAIMIYCLSALFKNDDPNKPKGLAEVFECVFGRFIGKIILIAYALWLTFRFCVQTRYYAERMLSTIFPDTDLRFFIVVMMFLVYMAVRGRIETFGRFSEAMLLLFVVLIIVFFVLLIPSVHISWVLPVTPKDIIKSAKESYRTVPVYALIPYVFFIGDSVTGKNKLIKKGKWTILFTALMPTLIVFFVTSSLGVELVKSLSLPTFSAMKIITFIQPLDRMEAVLLSAWVIADFVLIGSIAISLSHLFKRIFSLKESKIFAAPISLIGFIGGTFVASTMYKLNESDYSNPSVILSTVFSIILPLAALAVGKIRRVV